MIGLLLALSLATAADRCPLRRETWNLSEDDDGCPDGVRLDVRVTTADGEPEAGVTVRVEAPSGGSGVTSAGGSGERVALPLFVPRRTSVLEVVNGAGWPRSTGAQLLGVEPPWEYTVEAVTGRDGVATFRGLRSGVGVTVHVAGAAGVAVTVPGEDGEVNLPSGAVARE